jgi:hypothetical protein
MDSMDSLDSSSTVEHFDSGSNDEGDSDEERTDQEEESGGNDSPKKKQGDSLVRVFKKRPLTVPKKKYSSHSTPPDFVPLRKTTTPSKRVDTGLNALRQAGYIVVTKQCTNGSSKEAVVVPMCKKKGKRKSYRERRRRRRRRRSKRRAGNKTRTRTKRKPTTSRRPHFF